VAENGTPDIHRIGGGSVENLRLKSRESTLNPPGISVLKALSPDENLMKLAGVFTDTGEPGP
jgi:hypothetical protein